MVKGIKTSPRLIVEQCLNELDQDGVKNTARHGRELWEATDEYIQATIENEGKSMIIIEK